MSIILYDNEESVCCQKVRILLMEKGLKYELRRVSFEERDQFKPEFVKLNPLHRVPVMIHDGNIITESTIINQYIEDVFGGPKFVPENPYARAKQRLWSRTIDHLHFPSLPVLSFSIAFRHGMRGAGRSASENAFYEEKSQRASALAFEDAIVYDLDSPQFAKALFGFNDLLHNMETSLQNRQWLADDEFTLADIDIAPYVRRLITLKLEGMMDELPRVRDWCRRIYERESCQVAMIKAHSPKWLSAMEQHGNEAWPIVKKLLRPQ
jgi:glutathione S-transferase